MGEAASAMLDRTVTTVLNKFEGQIEYMHFSDQYSGPKLQDEGTPTKMPETKKVLTFCFNGKFLLHFFVSYPYYS